MKKVWKYILAICLCFLSVPLYLFVGFPNSTGGGTSFEYNTFNIVVFEVIPLVAALIRTAVAYFLYLKKLPAKKSNWLLIFELLNVFFQAWLVFYGFFLWDASDGFFGSIILAFLSIVLIILSLVPLAIRILYAIKSKKSKPESVKSE